MRVGFIVGIGAGLASALLFYSAARGAPLLGTILVLLTPLPSMIAGLAWGWLSAGFAALAGSILMGYIANVPFAVGYFLALGAPVALATYLAYLNRPHAHDQTQREW
jgi:ABC-type sugar transport system permease subunit